MKILIVESGAIPVTLYGGTERVIWGLGKELVKMGHEVVFLVKKGSTCPFAKVLPMDDTKKISEQIPEDIDLIHFNFVPNDLDLIKKPYLITVHGNSNDDRLFDKNTVFVSKNHANRFGSDSFVHNGLDWDEYAQPDLSAKRTYFHFLGKAAWRIKNVQGAIDVIKSTKKERLKVLGGKRFNFSMGLRLTFSTRVDFYGMVGGTQKYALLNGSKGLIFPVRWHEPFGLSIVESLFYGCPVFGTPYGSLPELVGNKVGFMSNNTKTLAAAVENSQIFAPKTCHEYARDLFNSRKMALSYLEKYERVLANQPLNPKSPQLVEIQKEKFLEWA